MTKINESLVPVSDGMATLLISKAGLAMMTTAKGPLGSDGDGL